MTGQQCTCRYREKHFSARDVAQCVPVTRQYKGKDDPGRERQAPGCDREGLRATRQAHDDGAVSDREHRDAQNQQR